MVKIVEPMLDGLDTFLAWLSTSLKQTTASYCDLETADDEHTIVNRDGSLISVIEVHGYRALIGSEEFDRLHEGTEDSYSIYGPGLEVQPCATVTLDSIFVQNMQFKQSAKGKNGPKQKK